MALYRPGVLVQEISGKIGSTEFAGGKSGRVIRRARVGSGGGSQSQLVHRNNYARVIEAWRQTTAEQRAGWAALAERLSKVDRIGVSKRGTAFRAFVERNLFLTGLEETFWDLDTPGQPILDPPEFARRPGWGPWSAIAYADGTMRVEAYQAGEPGWDWPLSCLWIARSYRDGGGVRGPWMYTFSGFTFIQFAWEPEEGNEPQWWPLRPRERWWFRLRYCESRHMPSGYLIGEGTWGD